MAEFFRLPHLNRRRLMIYLLLILLLVVGYGVFAWVVQRSILFPYRQIPQAYWVEPGKNVEVIWLETPAGRVESWFVPGEGVSAEEPGPVVLHAHGNGELIDLWQTELTRYGRMGVSVYLLEYRGYGRSDGSPTQKGILEDFVAFYDLVAQRPDVDPERIAFHGRSLGGAALTALAEHRPPRALILESAFTSVSALAKPFLIPPILVRDRFDTVATLRDLTVPTLILHGERDEVIPPWHAETNHAAARDSRLIFYNMDHNSPPPSQAYWSDIEEFLQETGVIP